MKRLGETTKRVPRAHSLIWVWRHSPTTFSRWYKASRQRLEQIFWRRCSGLASNRNAGPLSSSMSHNSILIASHQNQWGLDNAHRKQKSWCQYCKKTLKSKTSKNSQNGKRSMMKSSILPKLRSTNLFWLLRPWKRNSVSKRRSKNT